MITEDFYKDKENHFGTCSEIYGKLIQFCTTDEKWQDVVWYIFNNEGPNFWKALRHIKKVYGKRFFNRYGMKGKVSRKVKKALQKVSGQ